jgi:hypothetical protein
MKHSDHNSSNIQANADFSDILENKLEQAYSVLHALDSENLDSLPTRTVSGVVWTARDLIEDARAAFRGMCSPGEKR